PVLAIDATAIVRRTIPGATLTFTRHPNPGITPQGKAAEALDHVRRQGHEDFVRFEPWVPYRDRGAFFERYDVALLTFPQSIETDLSMRTRIYDYLWGGLPVVTSSATGTDQILQRYKAGSVLAAGGAEAFATEIIRVLQDGRRREEMVAGATRFVRDHQWPNALAPLRDFCRAPRLETSKESFAVPLNVPQQRPSILHRLRRRMGGAL
ncbi:MAG TPA: glycosyltransferase, partial [Thermoanaerobaculia bacterium]|nr:glycosyltransferase [Thermoanaerobaculia bacterium]